METSDQALQTRLKALYRFATVSQFSRVFYRMLVNIAVAGKVDLNVRAAVASLLEVEERHQALINRPQGSPRYEEQGAIAETAAYEQGLKAVREYALGLGPDDWIGQIVRNLVLAECAMRLQWTGEAIVALERVVKAGFRDPVVQWALGYQRYRRARELSTQATRGEDWEAREALSFRLQCLRAVSALEDGLQGSALDGEMYWWMGLILEAAGLTEAAEEAYDKAWQEWAERPELNAEQHFVAPLTDRHIEEGKWVLAQPLEPLALLQVGEGWW